MKTIIFLIILLLPYSVLAKQIDLGKEDMHCGHGMITKCELFNCASTMLYCGAPIVVLNKYGQWVALPQEDCNTTTCQWKCYCVDPQEYQLDLN